MLMHRHLIRGYKHALEVISHEVNNYSDLKYFLHKSPHLELFRDESTRILKELDSTTIEEGKKEQEIRTLISTFKITNEEREEKIVQAMHESRTETNDLRDSISECIELINNLKILVKDHPIQKGETINEREKIISLIIQTIRKIQMIIVKIEGLANFIVKEVRTDKKMIHNERKILKQKELDLIKISKNMNSWFL